MFKNWFKKKKVESVKTIIASVEVVVDEDGHHFNIKCPAGSETIIAELIFTLSSGQMLEECLMSLAKEIQDENRIKVVTDHVYSLLLNYSKEIEEDQNESLNMLRQSLPVVDPCNVFSSGEKNDFKG